jgi:hypothetical protein
MNIAEYRCFDAETTPIMITFVILSGGEGSCNSNSKGDQMARRKTKKNKLHSKRILKKKKMIKAKKKR